MGALFRLHLLQYWFMLSMFMWHGILLYKELTPFEGVIKLSSLPQLLPSLGTLLVLVGHIVWRRTIMFPLFLAVSSAWFFILFTENNYLHLYTFFVWIVMLAYPYFYYKFLDFKQMVSMFRWVFLAASLSLFGFIIKSESSVIDVVSAILIGVGAIGIFLHVLKLYSAIVFALGICGLVYTGITNASWIIVYLCATQIWLAITLYINPFSRELSPFLWFRYPYFRLVMLALLLAIVSYVVDWSVVEAANDILSTLPIKRYIEFHQIMLFVLL